MDSIQAKHRLERGLHYDETEPAKVVQFLERFCVQSQGEFAGQPLKLLPWQIDLIRNTYGWRHPDGRRAINRLLCFLPRRQGKSALISGLILWELLREPGAQCVVASGSVNQASNIFGYCRDYCELGIDPDGERFHVREHIRCIEYAKTRSKLSIVSSDPTGQSGKNISSLVIDEIAELPPSHERLLYDRLTGSMGNRKEPLTIIISSANFSRGLGYEFFERACEIQQGQRVEPLTHATVFSIDLTPEADWRDESNWAACLPSLGHNVQLQYYRDLYAQSKGNHADEAAFQTWYLNSFRTGHPDQWIETGVWERCKGTITPDTLKGCPVVCGMDLSYRADLSAYCLLFRDERTDTITLIPRFFTPSLLAKQKEKKDHTPYSALEAAGWITLTDGDVIDPQVIRKSLNRDRELFGEFEIRYDPWGATLLVQQLQEDGFQCLEIPQSKLSPPTGHFEWLVRKGRIVHDGNPVMAKNVESATCKMDQYENIRLDKRNSTGRIDGLVASIIGLTAYMPDPEATEPAWEGSFVSSV